MRMFIERQEGRRRKEKERVRDETEEEGYITGPKGRRQAQNGKRSAGGTSALGGNLFCADLVWKIRIVSSPSLALVLANRSVALPFNALPPPPHLRLTNFRQGILRGNFDQFRTHLIFPNPVPHPPLPLITSLP